MAIDHGWHGHIEIGSSAKNTSELPQINEWTLDFSMDALEHTNFGSTYDRQFQPGMRSAVASFSGYSEDSDNTQDYLIDNYTNTTGPYSSTGMHVVMLTNNTTGAKAGFKGNAVLTGLTRGATPDGLQTFSGTFQFANGVTTYAT